MLHNAIFLATCLTMLEKEIYWRLQKTCYTLQLPTETCNLFKTNSMQSLQKVNPSSAVCNRCMTKKVARQVAKRARHMLQLTFNFSRYAIATQVANKIALCNTSCRALFSSCSDCRDFFKPLQVAARYCNV